MAEIMIPELENCRICPRLCGINRYISKGACGEGADIRIAKIMIHKWEEPCISGSDEKRGSGAVFFSGCPLKCVFCQNKDISRGGKGEIYTPHELADRMKSLEDSGAYNINLVSPTHFIPQIKRALDIYHPSIPIVFNTGGWERAETTASLKGYADIFLTDFKYGSNDTAKAYSACGEYLETAKSALREMVKITGKPEFDNDGMLMRGTIVRHLILPGGRRDSVKALEAVAKTVDPKNVLLSLMSQYTPDFAPESIPALRRRITTFEYEYVRDAAIKLGFEGYSQDISSARRAYTPNF